MIEQEEELIPLTDAPGESHLHADDETVSSAPPRLEIDTSDDLKGEMLADKVARVSDDGDGKESNPDSLQIDYQEVTPRSSPLTTPANRTNNQSASTRKFVTFLSDADSTPIINSKRFADQTDGKMDRIRQPSIDEGNDEDEKKEDNKDASAEDSLEKRDVTNVAVPTSEELTAILSTPTEAVASNNTSPVQATAATTITQSPSRIAYVSPPGRRSITLRLLEEVDASFADNLGKLTPFKRLNLRRFRSLSLSTVMVPNESKIDMTDRQNNSNNGGSNSNSGGSSSNNNGSSGENHVIDRGIISVSWYEGTTSAEMTEHVFNCVLRKLRSGMPNSSNGEKKKLEDVRLLDENVVPHEEVVLCPFLPDGSHFLLRFKTKSTTPKPSHTYNHRNAIPPYISQAPDSPSAEPSPFPSSANLHGLNGNGNNTNAMNAQLQLLNAATALLQSNGIKTQGGVLGQQNGFSFPTTASQQRLLQQQQQQQQQLRLLPKNNNLIPDKLPNVETVPREFRELPIKEGEGGLSSIENEKVSSTTTANPTDSLIEQQLRQLHELFLLRNHQASTTTNDDDNTNSQSQTIHPQEEDHDPHLLSYYKSQEKKQVIFTIANYLVLFMSLIAISAEIQSRLPQWMAWVQDNYDSVQNCATDHDALFECISKGNFSGLVASFMLWATQSASAKRIFLFGFESPKKLWTVVYEALVSAVCWGLSYIFIRRGLNPNTREKFIQKYWKDAVYGSLAGFNAAFMKAVLKNLVPQDVALQAIENRQLKIFHWLGMLMSEE